MALDHPAPPTSDNEGAPATPSRDQVSPTTTTVVAQPEAPSSRRADLAGVALVAVLAAGAMAPTLRGTFLPGDDEHFVLHHSYVNRPGLINAVRLFGIIHRDLYQPIPMVSFAFDTALYGGQAWGFHLTDLLWHVLAAALVWLLVRLRWDHWWLATLTAALFAVHPQAVEAVATVTARIVQMGVTFSLAAIVAFLIWSRRSAGEGGWLAAAVLFTLLAMTSKVQPALPILLLIVVYGQQRRGVRAWWSAWGLLTGSTVAFVLLAAWTTTRTGLVASALSELHGSIPGRALMALGVYLVHLVWPVGLSTWYLPPVEWSWAEPFVWIGAAVLVGLVAAAVIGYARRARILSAGVTWYLAVIVPMLGASGARNLIAADRYTYLANIGLYLVAAGVVVFSIGRRGQQGAPWRVIAPRAVVVAGVIVALMVTTWRHTGHYRTALAYYERVAALYPNAPWVHLNVGWALARAGRLDEAERAANAELDMAHGDTARARQLLGWIAQRRGQLELAEEHFTAAAKAMPQDATAHYRLARLLHTRGRRDRALAAYQRALDVHPEHLPSLMGLAELHEQMRRSDLAEQILWRALQVNPQHVEAMTRLATLLLRQRRGAEAERLYRQVIDLDPGHAQAHTNLAAILAQTGREREALQHYQEALLRDPRQISARLNRANLLQRHGHNEGASEDYRVILALDPGCAPALEGMQEILLATRRPDSPQRAVHLWSIAIKHAGPRPGLLAGLAWAQAVAGMDQQAERTARTSLAKDPHRTAAHLALAMVAMHRKQVQPAVDALERACARGGPVVAEHLDRTARALSGYGIKHPTEPLPYYLLGRIMLARNNPLVADQAFAGLKKLTNDPVWRDRIRQAKTARQPTTSRPTTRPTGTPPLSEPRP